MLAVAALMASGCGDSEPAAPTAAAVAKPQNLYSNGPSTLNVFRTTDGFVFGLPDLQTGLLAWVGLPTDPTQDAGCGNGGNQTLQQVPMQFAGVYQAVNLLAVSPGDQHPRIRHQHLRGHLFLSIHRGRNGAHGLRRQ
jgi:hypothetical protein